MAGLQLPPQSKGYSNSCSVALGYLPRPDLILSVKLKRLAVNCRCNHRPDQVDADGDQGIVAVARARKPTPPPTSRKQQGRYRRQFERGCRQHAAGNWPRPLQNSSQGTNMRAAGYTRRCRINSWKLLKTG